MPCTVVNLVIAAVLSVTVGFFLSGLAGGVTLVLTVGAIYLRGYLVPGTPTITARYFPGWLLALFKSADDNETAEELDDADEFLRTVGVLETSTGDGGVHVSDPFRETWRERMDELRTEPIQPADVATVIDVPPAETTQRGPLQFQVGDQQAVQWESPAKMVADLAAGSELEKRSQRWETLDPAVRPEVLDRLRLAAERCPLCDEPLDVEDHQIGCCGRSTSMRQVRCDNCSTTLAKGVVSDGSA
jgi:hypothetical protein